MGSTDDSASDVFLSYNRDDQAVARRFAAAFEAKGLRVWWDTTLRAGEAYDEVTEAALRAARAVVVLWSPRAVNSRWVRAEATVALRNRTLVPCMIEPCERPIMFELTQTADLTHWRGAEDDPRWQAFLADVVRHVGKTDVIESFGSTSPAHVGEARPRFQPKAPEAARAVRSERRHLTFLSGRLDDAGAAARDPEDWHAIIEATAPQITAAVTAFGGVVRWHGSQMSAVFGYPIAHEDAAERAIRAGLAVIEIISRQGDAVPADDAAGVRARIGIHAATALVGPGRDGALEIFGDGAGVALRAQDATASGTVAMTAAVAELVTGLFDQAQLADIPAADGGATLVLYQALAARPGQRRPGAAQPGRRFIGRDEELALLSGRWRRACDGDGQHLLIKGEPGIGKTRLLDAFRGQLANQPHRWINWNGASLFANTPFYAVVHMLGQRIEARGGDAAAALMAELAAAGMPPDAFDLVATMMGLPLPPGQPTLDLPPVERRRRLLEALADWVFALTSEMPLVIVVEDLHWVDPSTLELVRILVEQGGTVPLLVIGTARPEFRKDWPDRDHHGQINLGRLDARQTRALVAETIGDAGVDDAVIETLIARTDGVPFFVEELARRLVAPGDGADEGRAGDIPTTLRGLLAARIDRLGAARETAQLGAVLGRSFSHAMIEAFTGIDAAELDSHLGLMVAEELVHQRGVPPRSTYSFKHALTHEAAYELLPKRRRTVEHARVAAMIATRFAGEAETHPEIVAHHHANGGNPEEAARCWLQAGQQALRRNAHLEAIAHLQAALAATAALPDTPETQRIELEIQTTLGTATVVAKGQASPEIEAVRDRALQLASALGDIARQGQAIFGLWLFETGCANHRAALAYSNTIVALARDEANEDLLMTGIVMRTSSSFFLGKVDDVLEGCDAILAAYDPDRHAGHRFQFGQDPAAMARAYRCQALWLKGEAAGAAAASEDALNFARQLHHNYSLAHVVAYSGWMSQYGGAEADVEVLAAELTALCTSARIPLFLGNGIMLTGWLRYRRGETDGPVVYEQGLDIYRGTATRCFLPYRWALLGDMLSARGDATRAAALFDAALAAIEATSERWAEPEVHRLHALSLARAGADAAVIEARFAAAITSARELGLGGWERSAIASHADFAAR